MIISSCTQDIDFSREGADHEWYTAVAVESTGLSSRTL